MKERKAGRRGLRRTDIMIHGILVALLFLTMVPFAFVINNSMRTNSEIYRDFFGLPGAVKDSVRFSWYRVTGQTDQIQMRIAEPVAAVAAETSAEELEVADEGARGVNWVTRPLEYSEAIARNEATLTRGYRFAWKQLRPYMLNTIVVAAATVFGVLLLGSITGYVFSRYRFRGRGVLFAVLLSIIMVPPVLTLVPSFLLVKELNLLNSYWVLILPYVAGGQIVAIFLFKSFFDGLPEELFEAARIEGAGHFALYWHIVLPLSRQIAAVVAIITILGVWNNFIWPFITNTDSSYHVMASGLFLMSDGSVGQYFATMYAGFVISAVPLIILFVYATRPFMKGVTAGALKG